MSRIITTESPLILEDVPKFAASFNGPLPKKDDIIAADEAFATWWRNVKFRLRKQFDDLRDVTPALNAETSTKTADYEIQLKDGTILCDAARSGFSITLPAAGRVANKLYNVKKIDATSNQVTIYAQPDNLIDGATKRVLMVQYQSLSIQSDGLNFYLI